MSELTRVSETPRVTELEDGTLVYRTAQWSPPGCHGVGCGLRAFVKDGKLVKVEGDPDQPIINGRLCVRCLTLPEYIYHKDRLLHPMKRDRKFRGQADKWERISWDEAYDIIVEKYHELTEKYGPDTVSVWTGTGREASAYQFQTCNQVFHSRTAIHANGGWSCVIPRQTAMDWLLGCAYVEYDGAFGFKDRYDDPRYELPKYMLVWGRNPLWSNPDGLFGHSVIDMMKRGTKLIVVDPRASWLAMHAEYHFQIRPGTDAALAMALNDVIIEEDLYDHEFVDRWTYGFNEYAERCKTMTPEIAADICGVNADDIRAAARCLAQKPCTASVGLKTDQNPNTLQICHAVWGIFAICGNLDNPGGVKLGQTMLNGGSTGRKGVGMQVNEEDTNPIPIAGHDQYPAMDFIINTTQPDCTLDTLRTNIPYPIEFLFIQSSNFISSCITQQPMQWLEACRHKEFVCATDIFMNPTIQALADVVLPVSTSLEHEGIVTFHGCNQPGQFHALTKVLEPLGECKSDLQIMLDLDHRINPDRTEDLEKWSSEHGYLDNKIQSIPYTENVETGGKMTYETLREWVYGRYEIPYYQYEKGLLRADGKPGFKSPTGRVELWSTVKNHLGEDPLPYYEEPRFSKRSRPEWAKKYPLEFVTGARRATSFHTEHRMIDSLREIRRNATVEINPVTAEKYGIHQGDWVKIENPWGACEMVADITPIVKEDVIGCDHGWWYPEEKDAELFGVWKSNINELMPWKEIGKLGLGSHYGALPCKISRAEG